MINRKMGGEMKKSEVGINSNKEMEVITMAKINKAVHWNPSVQSPQQPKLSQTLLQKLQNAGMHKSNSENCTSDKTGTVKKMVLQKANDRNKKHLGSLGTKSHNLSKDRHSVTVEVFVQNEDQLIKQINNAGGPKESMTTATTESGKSENIGTDKVTREGPRWTSHSNHGAIDQHLLKSEKHKQNKRSTVVASLSNQASKQGNVVNKRYIVAPSGSLSPTSERQKRTLNRLNNKQSQGHQLEKYVRPPGVYMTGPGGHYAVDTRIHKNNNTAGDPVVSSSSGGKLQNSLVGAEVRNKGVDQVQNNPAPHPKLHTSQLAQQRHPVQNGDDMEHEEENDTGKNTHLVQHNRDGENKVAINHKVGTNKVTSQLSKELEELSARHYLEKLNRLPKDFKSKQSQNIYKDESGSDASLTNGGAVDDSSGRPVRTLYVLKESSKETSNATEQFHTGDDKGPRVPILKHRRSDTHPPPTRTDKAKKENFRNVRFKSEQYRRLERQDAYDAGDADFSPLRSILENTVAKDVTEENSDKEKESDFPTDMKLPEGYPGLGTVGSGSVDNDVNEEVYEEEEEVEEESETYILCLRTDDGDLIGPFRLDVDESELGIGGLRNRQVGAHNLNETSSRSHSMLSLMIDSEVPDGDENIYITKHGKLTFVDLAGSEKVKDSGSSGEQLIESNNINKSLLVLGNCISALGDAKKRQGHIPYRDSKLTKLLADSLGGNGVALMIACISPSASNVGETMNTLRYANRAKKIRNKPVVQIDPRESLLISLKKELKVLRQENHYLRQQLNFPDKPKGKLAKGNDEGFKELLRQATKMKLEKDREEAAVNPTGASGAVPKQDSILSDTSAALNDNGLYEMLQEYMIENETLRSQNSGLHSGKDKIEREHEMLSRENEKLLRKLEQLDRIMTRSPSLYSARSSGYSQRSTYDWIPSYDSTPLQTPPYYQSRQQYWYDSPSSQSSARSRDPRDAWYTPPPAQGDRYQLHGRSRSSPNDLPPLPYNNHHGGNPYDVPPGGPNGYQYSPPQRQHPNPLPPPHPGNRPPHRLPPAPKARTKPPTSYSDKFQQQLEQKQNQEPANVQNPHQGGSPNNYGYHGQRGADKIPRQQYQDYQRNNYDSFGYWNSGPPLGTVPGPSQGPPPVMSHSGTSVPPQSVPPQSLPPRGSQSEVQGAPDLRNDGRKVGKKISKADTNKTSTSPSGHKASPERDLPQDQLNQKLEQELAQLEGQILDYQHLTQEAQRGPPKVKKKPKVAAPR